MKTKTRNILSILIAAALLLTCIPASAEQPESTVYGSLDARVGSGSSDYSWKNIVFTLWKLATGEYNKWKTDPALGDLELGTQKDGSVMSKLADAIIIQRIRESKVSGWSSTTDSIGEVYFDRLQAGVYFLRMTDGPSGLKVKPMLISIPDKDGDWNPDIKVSSTWAGDNKDGKITVTIKNKDQILKKEGIRLDAYLIATGDFRYWKMLPAFETFSRDGERYDMTYNTKNKNGHTIAFLSGTIEDIAGIIDKNKIYPTQQETSDENGIVTFSNLRWGIYYIRLGNGPKDMRMTDMLLSVPDAQGTVAVTINAKSEYNAEEDGSDKPEMLIVPIKKGERLVNIDEYETALGLGNIQMHVGVCFE